MLGWGGYKGLGISGDSVARYVDRGRRPRQRGCLLGRLESEEVLREASRRTRSPRAAALSVLKSLKGFDWSLATTSEGPGRSDVESLSFLECCGDLVHVRGVGTGWTHMATMLRGGVEASFHVVLSPVAKLWRAKAGGGLDRELAWVARASVAVIDTGSAACRSARTGGEVPVPGRVRRPREEASRNRDKPRARSLGCAV